MLPLMQPTPRVVWRWDRHPNRKTGRVWQLDPAEQANVKAAVRKLRLRYGRKRLGELLGVTQRTLKHSTEGKRSVSAGMALRVARAAWASVEEVLDGTWKGVPPCPMCG